MAKRSSTWRPHGKTPDEILGSLLTEATAIISQFEQVAARHAAQIEVYRDEHARNTNGNDIDRWKQETLLKNLFEIAEPVEFDYDFHERRRVFLDQVESGADLDPGSIFIDVCMLAGIKPLVTTVVNAREFRRYIYGASDVRSEPELDPTMFDLLEVDVTLLRMYVDASKFYGADQFLMILMQKYKDPS
jgi:hypothetical protein